MNFMGVELEIDENGWLNITQAVKPFFKKADKYPTLVRCQREAQRFGISKITEVRSAGYALQTWLHPALVEDFLDWLPTKWGKHAVKPLIPKPVEWIAKPQSETDAVNCQSLIAEAENLLKAARLLESAKLDVEIYQRKLESDLYELKKKLCVLN